MEFLKSDGFVINKTDVGEADRYITVFLKDFGKMTFLVKGIRKSKRRDKMAVEVMSLSEFIFYQKGDNYILSKFNSINNFDENRKDINKLNTVYYFLIVLNCILVENGRNVNLYNLLKKSLEFLNETQDERKIKFLIVYFLYEIILEEGILFELEENHFYIGEEQEKLSQKEADILSCLLNGKFKKILTDIAYNTEDAKKTILLLEKYLNVNLELSISAKKIFYWG